ncbi:hypothetical protein BJF93_20825 [Xaviernesmea oryzae]|uniref:Putative Flp pilus-assembly TadG-like N-terminal domain-containing protein n=1 Tax=Xaviernesmea oryzae TaxID=464029 RepID=A0A1Q9AZT1_9HYPH|nr:pilus assembly protein TadG-related protein [Xaviernesmea oryzae]OLP61236.1 hypothetical protein BJF93_20825 [Xaviernesmea oryzae]SEL51453.1 Flp pilus assembly protein TadG [Xaviernesmea oryzae]
MGLAKDRSGNFAMMSALLLLPLAGALGLGIDVSHAVSVKHELQAAADAAALAALASGSAGVKAAMQQGDGEVEAAETESLSAFDRNAGAKSYKITRHVEVTKDKGILTAKVTFQAHVPTSFSRVLGQKTMDVGGSAIAKFSTGIYRDFYLLLDNSPSMGLGATYDDIATMKANTDDSCAFACHIVKNGVEQPTDTYKKARALGVTTRIDVVASATASLMDTASRERLVSNQFRMAVYSFGKSAETRGLTEIVGLTNDLDQIKTKAGKVDLMSIPSSNYDKDQMTDYDGTIAALQTQMGNAGTGMTSSEPEKVLFLVTDGVNDANKPTDCSQAVWRSTRCQEPIDIRICDSLKDKGLRIAVLYTTYLPLPGDDWYKKWISPFAGQIAPALKACASPNFFFEVNPSEGIPDAMKALFMKVINAPRLVS